MSILWKVEQFLRHSSMPATKFGRLAINDPRLVDDLRQGREPRPRTAARIEVAIMVLGKEMQS